MVAFEENQVPQILTGGLYQLKNEERLKQLFELEHRVYQIFSEISAARSRPSPVPLAMCAESLRRVLTPFVLYLEPMIQEKTGVIGHDYWHGKRPNGEREFHLGELDIPHDAEWTNVREKSLWGVAPIVELPERLTYGIKSTEQMMGYQSTGVEYIDTVIPYDCCVSAFRFCKDFLERIGLNLAIEDKLPWEIPVKGYNDERFI